MNDEHQKLRQSMVSRQLELRGIWHSGVLDAMAHVPRHCFVPEGSEGRAYHDQAMSIGCGQTISQPFMVAAITQHAMGHRNKVHKALEVGAGSGYQAAVLSQLADEVYAIERVGELATRCTRTLARLGYDNVEVVAGDGTLGHPDQAPYDVIIVSAGAPSVPKALKDQLSRCGQLVVPAGSRGLQQLAVVHRHESRFRERWEERCVFVPLIGEQGWDEDALS